MALTHTTATRNAISDAVLVAIGASGKMTGRTSGDVEVFTLTLPATSGTVGATDLTFGTFTDDTSATGGIVAHIRIETTAGTEVFRFNASGDGVTMSSTTIGATDTVQCSSLVYAPPA